MTPAETNDMAKTANIADIDRAAATRHDVYSVLLDMLPPASYDQALQFAANLRLRAETPVQKSAALSRFLSLRVTPDIAETVYRGATQKEIETWLNKKYGERLALLAGFYRRHESSTWRLNLPGGCVLYGYRSLTRDFSGILCQPVDRLDSFFLLSASCFGGAKAVRLLPSDEQYFTQYSEVAA